MSKEFVHFFLERRTIMKYIVFNSPTKGEFMLLFPEHITHAFLKQCIQNSYPGIEVASAGFVHIKTKQCYGLSKSLNVVSRPEKDTILLNLLLREEQ